MTGDKDTQEDSVPVHEQCTAHSGVVKRVDANEEEIQRMKTSVIPKLWEAIRDVREDIRSAFQRPGWPATLIISFLTGLCGVLATLLVVSARS